MIQKDETRATANPNQRLRAGVALAALVFGLAGQWLLSGKYVGIGAILTGLAALLFVFAFWNQPGPDVRLNEGQPRPKNSKRTIWGIVILGIAVLFSALAFWSFGVDIPAYYPWLLHRWSIVLLLLAAFLLDPFKFFARDDRPNQKGWTWLEAGIFLFILAIAAFMRLYRFDEIPFGLWYDEGDNGVSALAILNSPEKLPVFVKSTNLPAHFLYLIAFSFQTLGVSVFALRMVSVVFGMATVIASFFLGNELFDRRLGLVLAFFLAVSRWDVNWSRIGMHGVTVPFLTILSCLLVLRALRTQSLLAYTLAGLSLGLGLCFYTPLYFFPIAIAVFLLFLWSRRHDLVSSSWRGFALLALGFLVVSVPVSQFAIRHRDSFDDRLRVTSVFTGKTTSEAWRAVARNTVDHFLMFNYRGDRNGRHNLPNEPMLDPVSGALMVLGFALSLRRLRQTGSFLPVAWLVVMLMPGIFSLDYESPQSLRAIGSLPSAYLLALVPIDALWREWENSATRRSAVVFVLPLVLVLGAAGYVNYHIYFDIQSKRFDSWRPFSTTETIIGRTLSGLGDEVDIYFSKEYFYASPTIQFLAPNAKEFRLLKRGEALPIPEKDGRTKAFFMDPLDLDLFLQARERYASRDASFAEHLAPDGTVVLYQVIIEP